MGLRAYLFSSPMVVKYDYGSLQFPFQALTNDNLQSPFQALQSPYGILQYSFQALQSPYNSLQYPQELARSPFKTLVPQMSEMRNRMKEKWSEWVF
jgi:hypothetical protein